MSPEQQFYLWAAIKTGRTSEIIEQRCARNYDWQNMRDAYVAGFSAGRVIDDALATETKALPHERVEHINGAKDCPKCRGAGWLYGRELDNPDDDTYADTMTKYSCDGEPCIALNRGVIP